MMLAKMANPGLLKIKFFWYVGHGDIISLHDVTNKISSHNSNFILDVITWPKFDNLGITMREVIITLIL